MEHGKHLIRAFLILLTAGLVLFTLRFIEKPDTFGELGHFRASNLTEQRLLPVSFGATDACAECHDDVTEVKRAGAHNSVACESCHAPLASHVRDEENFAEMTRKKVAALCINCHQKLQGRPRSHPQVVVRDHLEDMGAEWNTEVCYECHDPHDPGEMPE